MNARIITPDEVTNLVQYATDEQREIIKRFSRLVGFVLTQAEASAMSKDKEIAFKKVVEKEIYNARNDILWATRGKTEEEN